MLTLVEIKTRAAQFDVPFENLLALGLLEELAGRIAESSYGDVLWLYTPAPFGKETVKKAAPLYLHYAYIEQERATGRPGRPFDQGVLLQLSAALFSDETEIYGLTWQVKLGNRELFATGIAGDIRVPVHIRITPIKPGDYLAKKETFPLLTKNDASLTLRVMPEEWLLADRFVAIMEKLELLGEMGYFTDIYDVINETPLDGRKVWEYTRALALDRKISRDMDRLTHLLSLENSPYLKKKWRMTLRQRKRTEPELSQLLSLLGSFFTPIWQSICDDGVFFGDWMPDIRRFL